MGDTSRRTDWPALRRALCSPARNPAAGASA